MPKKYMIRPLVWSVKDEAGVRFHVQSDDYFGTIATILRLLRQKIKKDGCADAAVFKKTLNNLESDLLFLQTNYYIQPKVQSKPRIKKRKTNPKGKLKSQ
ncbi:MAG: hypothetical protein WC456_02875 [Patescibacteria group bacterium]